MHLYYSKRRKQNFKAFRWNYPIEGWNLSPQLSANLVPQSAILFENWIADKNAIKIREGFSVHHEGLASPFTYLFNYSKGNSQQMLAMSESAIYEVTIKGKSTNHTALKEGFTSGDWFGINFLSHGVFVNGRDHPIKYDGKKITNLSLTGEGQFNSFSFTHSYRNRIYFLANNQSYFYYLNYKCLEGEVHRFNLAGIMRKGGSLLTVTTLTLDGGNGPHEVLAFLTNMGEVILYRGDDPDSEDGFELIGIYSIPKPLSKKGILPFGDDVLVLTDQGYIPLYASLPIAESHHKKTYSSRITDAIQLLVKGHPYSKKWQITHAPALNLLIVNLPDSTQHVMQTEINAWSHFKGLHASSWGYFKGDLYFTSGNKICLYGGKLDDKKPIEAKLKSDFYPIHDGFLNKRFQTATLDIKQAEGESYSFSILCDHETRDFSKLEIANNAVALSEDNWIENWEDDSTSINIRQKKYHSIGKIGKLCALQLSVLSNQGIFTFYGADLFFEIGGI